MVLRFAEIRPNLRSRFWSDEDSAYLSAVLADVQALDSGQTLRYGNISRIGEARDPMKACEPSALFDEHVLAKVMDRAHWILSSSESWLLETRERAEQ
ncbi:MAG: hypothetical protein KJZ87_09155 [Thermoguttaceae bacterium]|nr:hypothetical protein [Thermoguttaceae bacterium]